MSTLHKPEMEQIEHLFMDMLIIYYLLCLPNNEFHDFFSSLIGFA